MTGWVYAWPGWAESLVASAAVCGAATLVGIVWMHGVLVCVCVCDRGFVFRFFNCSNAHVRFWYKRQTKIPHRLGSGRRRDEQVPRLRCPLQTRVDRLHLVRACVCVCVCVCACECRKRWWREGALVGRRGSNLGVHVLNRALHPRRLLLRLDDAALYGGKDAAGAREVLCVHVCVCECVWDQVKRGTSVDWAFREMVGRVKSRSV